MNQAKSELQRISPLKFFVRLSLVLLRTILGLCFIMCLACHLWFKDTIGALAFVYYSAPLPVLAGLALLNGVLWWLELRPRLARFYFVFTLGSLLWWAGASFSWNLRAEAPDNIKVFCWNAASNRDANALAHYVASFDADVVGIVEAGIRSNKVSTWQRAFPHQHVEKLHGNMAFITKGKVLAQHSGSLGGRGRFNLVEIELRGARLCLLLVDFDSDPFRSRLPAFAPVLDLIRTHAQNNLIVMGNFNTPEDSIFFEAFRPYLQHAFAAGGMGFAKSWPLPAPLLTIDHIWVSQAVDVVNCTLDWTSYSDHRPVVANIALPLPALGEIFSGVTGGEEETRE